MISSGNLPKNPSSTHSNIFFANLQQISIIISNSDSLGTILKHPPEVPEDFSEKKSIL